VTTESAVTGEGIRAPGGDFIRKRGGGRGEQSMVPPATFTSYYGRPILKRPVWTHDIAGYLFTGGLAAGSSLLAAGADLTGRPAMRRAGRATAMAGLLASTVLLAQDLGRPERFLNMLRVAKPTSPMSMGSWILSAYGVAAGAAAAAEVAEAVTPRGRVARPLSRLVARSGRPAGLAAAAAAPALATYTAVLLSDTAVPSWHEAYPQLPFLFAGSALASGAAVGLVAAPAAEVGPAQRLAVLGAGLELVAVRSVRAGLGLLSEPYAIGRAGRLLEAGEMLTAGGVAGSLLGRRSRVVRTLSGLSLLSAALVTRFGVFEAGVASTEDPKFVVVPQRERLAERMAADGQRTSTVTPSDRPGSSSPTTG